MAKYAYVRIWVTCWWKDLKLHILIGKSIAFLFLMQGSFSSPETFFSIIFLTMVSFPYWHLNLLNTLARQIFVLWENMGVTVIKFIKVFQSYKPLELCTFFFLFWMKWEISHSICLLLFFQEIIPSWKRNYICIRLIKSVMSQVYFLNRGERGLCYR